MWRSNLFSGADCWTPEPLYINMYPRFLWLLATDYFSLDRLPFRHHQPNRRPQAGGRQQQHRELGGIQDAVTGGERRAGHQQEVGRGHRKGEMEVEAAAILRAAQSFAGDEGF